MSDGPTGFHEDCSAVSFLFHHRDLFVHPPTLPSSVPQVQMLLQASMIRDWPMGMKKLSTLQPAIVSRVKKHGQLPQVYAFARFVKEGKH